MTLANISKTLRLILIQGVVILILLELLLRIYNPVAGSLKGNKIVLRSNSESVITNFKYAELPDEWTVRTNSLGFRGHEPPEDFGEATTIVAVGGSTTLCMSMDDNSTWTSRLLQNLQQEFPSLWINNAGLNGHSTYGHKVLIEDHILPLKPDYLLLLVGINDLKNSPEFDFKFVPSRVKVLFYKSEIVRVILNLYRMYKAGKIVFRSNGVTISELFQQPLRDISKEAKMKLVLEKREHLDAYEDRLREIVSVCQSANITPVLLTQPLLFGEAIDPSTGHDLSTIWIDFLGSTSDVYAEIIEEINDRTRILGQYKGVHLIDLASQLSKDSKYYLDGIHYSIEGNKKIADLLAPELEKILVDF